MAVEAYERLAVGTVVTILVTPNSNLNGTTATIVGWEKDEYYILDNGTNVWAQPAWTCYQAP